MNIDSFKELHNMKEYSKLEPSTEETCFVSGINCTTFNTYKEMQSTKKQYDKTDGILGFHAFQSFKEGEVTPEVAHEIGIKLAEEMWGDRFEVIVTTHINTNHIHNHFVINSVSFKDGKKYSDNRKTYAELRYISDSLCEEYGLNVLKNVKCEKSKINYDNYYKGYVKTNNYHTKAKEDLDNAIAMANSYKDFIYIMNYYGYEVINRYNKLSIKKINYKKNIRIERAYGENYSIEKIKERIDNTFLPRILKSKNYSLYKKNKTFEKSKKQKSNGLYGLYKYYCYILKVYPRHYPKKIISPTLKLEIEKMHEISKETRILISNKIETYEQLLFYEDKLQTDSELFSNRRKYLWKKYKRVTDTEEKTKIRNEIDDISKFLDKFRTEIKLCENIKNRQNIMNRNIKEFEEKLKRKEKDKDEF